jgi:hypothetical protein
MEAGHAADRPLQAHAAQPGLAAVVRDATENNDGCVLVMSESGRNTPQREAIPLTPRNIIREFVRCFAVWSRTPRQLGTYNGAPMNDEKEPHSETTPAKEITPADMADVLREAAIFLSENMQASLGTDCQYAADAIERIIRSRK